MRDLIVNPGTSNAFVVTPLSYGFVVYSYKEPTIAVTPNVTGVTLTSQATATALVDQHSPAAYTYRTVVSVSIPNITGADLEDPSNTVDLYRYTAEITIANSNYSFQGLRDVLDAFRISAVDSNIESALYKPAMLTSGGQLVPTIQAGNEQNYYFYTQPGLYYSSGGNAGGNAVVNLQPPYMQATHSRLAMVVANSLTSEHAGGVVFKGPWYLSGHSVHEPVFCVTSTNNGWVGENGVATLNGATLFGGMQLTPKQIWAASVTYTQPPHVNYTSGGVTYHVHGDNALVVGGNRLFHTVGKLIDGGIKVYDESDKDYPSFLYKQGSNYVNIWSDGNGIGSTIISGAQVTSVTHVAFPYIPLNGMPHVPFVFSCGEDDAIGVGDVTLDDGANRYTIFNDRDKRGVRLWSKYSYTPQVYYDPDDDLDEVQNPYRYIAYSGAFIISSGALLESSHRYSYHSNTSNRTELPNKEQEIIDIDCTKKLKRYTEGGATVCEGIPSDITITESTYRYKTVDGGVTVDSGAVITGKRVEWLQCPQPVYVSATYSFRFPKEAFCDGAMSEDPYTGNSSWVPDPVDNTAHGTWTGVGMQCDGQPYTITYTGAHPGRTAVLYDACNQKRWAVDLYASHTFLPLDGSPATAVTYIVAPYDESDPSKGNYSTRTTLTARLSGGESRVTPGTTTPLAQDISEIALTYTAISGGDIEITATYRASTTTAVGAYPGPVTLVHTWDDPKDPNNCDKSGQASIDVTIQAKTIQAYESIDSQTKLTYSGGFITSSFYRQAYDIPDTSIELEAANPVFPSLYSGYRGVYVGGLDGTADYGFYRNSDNREVWSQHLFSHHASSGAVVGHSNNIYSRSYISGGKLSEDLAGSPPPTFNATISGGVVTPDDPSIWDTGAFDTPVAAVVNTRPIGTEKDLWAANVSGGIIKFPDYSGNGGLINYHSAHIYSRVYESTTAQGVITDTTINNDDPYHEGSPINPGFTGSNLPYPAGHSKNPISAVPMSAMSGAYYNAMTQHSGAQCFVGGPETLSSFRMEVSAWKETITDISYWAGAHTPIFLTQDTTRLFAGGTVTLNVSRNDFTRNPIISGGDIAPLYTVSAYYKYSSGAATPLTTHTDATSGAYTYGTPAFEAALVAAAAIYSGGVAALLAASGAAYALAQQGSAACDQADQRRDIQNDDGGYMYAFSCYQSTYNITGVNSMRVLAPKPSQD